MQVSEHIYMILGGMYANLANVYALKGENSLILIDTAENEADRSVMEKTLERFSLDHLPVRYVLLTHKHYEIGRAHV